MIEREIDHSPNLTIENLRELRRSKRLYPMSIGGRADLI